MLKICIVLIFLSTIYAAEECENTDDNTITFKVYYGWPFMYSCVNIFHSVDYDYDLVDFGDYTCLITEVESGKVLFNTSFAGSLFQGEFEPADRVKYKFDTIDRSTPTEYRANIQNSSSCWIEYFTLQPSELQDETCEKNLETVTTHSVHSTVGSLFEARCDVPGDSEFPFELVDTETINPENTRIYWLYNCAEKLPNNAELKSGLTSLILTNVSYETNPGIYTCVVEHKNMKRYRIHHKICVKEIVSRAITISCADKRVRIGDDAEITCHVDAGVGIETSVAFYGRFNKLNATREIDYNKKNSSCVSIADRGSSNSRNGRFSCQLNIDGEAARKCFDRPPTKEELKKQTTSLTMHYRIKNVQESDFGEYRAQINRNNIAMSWTFSLTKNIEENLERHNMTLILCISLICGFVLFFIMICVLCGVELRWIWFKLCVANEEETRKYSAYLAYYYSRDTTQSQSPQLKAFILNLSTRLQRFGGPVFDKCREPSTEQYKAESIFAKLGQCHRVVIVLTPEYINDQWSVYEAYEAWKNVIEHGIKILFITFPNTTSAIANLPERSRNALEKALQRHKVVHWGGTLPFNQRMRMQLEMFMPKLPGGDAMELQISTLDDDEQLITAKQNGNGVITNHKDTNGNVYHSSIGV